MNAREQMLLEYSGLGEGQTATGERCPVCGGGETEEASLNVSNREGVLLWKCHRASCGYSGAATCSGQTYRGGPAKVPETRGVVGRTIARESDVVDEATRQYLASKYSITNQHIAKWELGWDNASQRLALPVQNFRGERTGVVLRALDGRKPKTLTHTEKDSIAWYVNHTAPGVIIVEDQLSAIRASDYLTSVALLGTHLNEERVQEIRSSGYSPVYLALDADAFGQAIKLAIKYRTQLRPRLVKLERDIKDESNQALSRLLSNLSSPDI